MCDEVAAAPAVPFVVSVPPEPEHVSVSEQQQPPLASGGVDAEDEAEEKQEQGADEGQAGVEEAGGSGKGGAAVGGAPLSKNQQKKLIRNARMEKEKAARKEKERETKKARKETRKAEMFAVLESCTPEERAARLAGFRETRAERTRDDKARKQALAQGVQAGTPLVLDLDFPGMMNESELRHLCQQLSYSYSVNRKAPRPCHLHLLGLKAEVKACFERQITGGQLVLCVWASLDASNRL
ncbi:hypothetical protein FOA52_009284 [Chlamydomonas sp. UWO 241]|nr:hypothetical protein FOA52_009284 [Chlamydomonas sp. UWO 241]